MTRDQSAQPGTTYQYRTLYDGVVSEWQECSPQAYENVADYDWYERRRLVNGVEQ